MTCGQENVYKCESAGYLTRRQGSFSALFVEDLFDEMSGCSHLCL